MFTKEVKEKIQFLKNNDPKLRIFGATYHKYLFNNKVSTIEISKFEKANNSILPEDYKNFLIEIGNGGAGPYYGLNEFNFEKPTDFRFEDKNSIDISKPFSHQKAWNQDWVNTHNWNNGRPSKELLDKYWDTNIITGSYPICHYGHGDCFLIILNGDQKGKIWFDGRGNYSGLEPEYNDQNKVINFAEWYLKWLDKSIKSL